MNNNRPKIGVRPIIDGRRGRIRESLDAMITDMVRRIARLYGKELRYSDGTSVECVIADTTIGRVAEAAARVEKFRRENVGADLVTLASMLRILIAMHNLPEESLFRPSAWGAFGTDPEGSDFRTCKNYGPLYR